MRAHVVCFGNLLAGDDGFGIHVLSALREAPPAVEGLEVALFDGGVMGFAALGYFDGCDAVVVVDALALRSRPGALRVLELSEVAAPRSAFSAHALDLTHLFHVLPILFEDRAPPRVRIVGAEIVPPQAAFSTQLTSPVAQAVRDAPRWIARVLAQLAAPSPSKCEAAARR